MPSELFETMKRMGRAMAYRAGDYVYDKAELADILIGSGTAYGVASSGASAALAFALITVTAVGSAAAIRYCKHKVQ